VPILRLVENTAAVVSFDDASARANAESALRAEARAFAALNGPNVYSDFVVKHGRRPDPNHAAILGRLIGRQVKASDGSMQPRRTKAQREAWRLELDRRRIGKRRRITAGRIKAAMECLAQSEIDAEDVIASLDDSALGAHLDSALRFLSRLAEETDRVEIAGRTMRPPNGGGS
jgi:hypothetical protein